MSDERQRAFDLIDDLIRATRHATEGSLRYELQRVWREFDLLADRTAVSLLELALEIQELRREIADLRRG